jgi:uncharacterized membrane protein
MSELLTHTLEAMRGLPPALTVFIISALPVFEIRGGVLAGLAFYKMPVDEVLFFGFLGNIASVTPLLLFLEPITKWLYGNQLADRLLHWLFERARRKAGIVNRWGVLGLLLFVAIPAPGTGAWTGTIVAIVLGIHRGRAIGAIYLGIIIAALLVSVATLAGMAGVKTLAP